MNKKGFTLIELLAIIVILAIIAVITVPLILGIIDNAKEKAVMDSAYGYKDAVNKMYTTKLLNDNDYKMEDRVYTISELNTEGVSVSGKQPDSNSWIQIENNNVKAGCLQFDEYKVDITNGNIGSAQKSECVIPFNPTSLIVTSGDGLYESTTEPGRLIYRGANPNNYITLNEGTASSPSNITYRIISYEPDGTIKVIRDASIGSKAFDETVPRHNTDNTFCNYSGTYYGCNVWGNLSNTFYNGSTLGDTFNYKYYVNNTNTELTNSTNTGTVTVDSTLNQYLNNTWITDKEMSKYINNHDFNVGGVYYTSSYTGGDKGLQKEESEEKLYTWNGKIGLMNITDYVETSLNPTCTSVYSNYYYNTNYYYEKSQHITGYDNWPCSNRTYNWLPKQITEWSLSPFSNNRYHVWYVSSSGFFLSYNANYVAGVRPAFYLKSEISLTGEGTSGNPYTISNM